MGLVLIGLMIVIPILEIAVFIIVGRQIGLWPTLAGIVLTAVIGSAIIRHQGIGILAKARRSMEAGEAPVAEVLEGLALLLAGALLITPGFVTDTLGFLCLLPGLRRRIAAAFVARMLRKVKDHVRAGGDAAGPWAGGPRRGPAAPSQAGVTIEGEWKDLGDGSCAEDAGDPDGPEFGKGWGRKSSAAADDYADTPRRERGGGG
jgi:UPF0716 protein FxsA